jgi:hypothetical protein
VRPDSAVGQGTKGRAGTGAWIRSLVNRVRIAAKDREETRSHTLAREAGPSVEERQQELARFYRHYEDLVETLCDAAQYGPTPKLETQYAALRHWMHQNYAPVRRYVVAYLQFSVEDAQQSLEMQGRAADAFEALCAAPDLDTFLRIDDGAMITRITRTRDALNLYGEHLRQLAAAAS